jgi:hypothetical protein
MAGQLHNLAEDIAEAKDLAAENPAKVEELKGLWDQWNAEQAPPSSPKEQPNRRQRNKQRQKQQRATAAAVRAADAS